MSERFASEVSQPLETLGVVVQKTLQVLRSDVLEATWSSIAGDGSVEGVPGADLRMATAKGLALELETALASMHEKIGAQVVASSSGGSSSPMDVSERPGATSGATGASRPSAPSRMHPFFSQPAAKRTRTGSDSTDAATTAAATSDSAAATTTTSGSPTTTTTSDSAAAEGASASAEPGGEVEMREGDSE